MNILKPSILVCSFICISKLSNAQFIGSSPIQQASAGNVAIGFPVYTPSSLLQVKNGSVLFDGITGATPTSGAGTRMMWIPAKVAFRAGTVNGNYWDDSNIGTSSTAFGTNTTASGQGSTAFGIGSTASTIASTALGAFTKANGGTSFAAGGSTTASGDISTAFGTFTTAQPFVSFVLGRYNYNPGTYNPNSWVLTDPLFVIGNGTSGTATSNAMTVLKNGNTGIGVTTPIAPLHIATSLSTGEGLILDGTKVDPTNGGKWAMGDGLFISDGIFSISDAKGSGNPIPRLTINSSGTVGIGTTLADPSSLPYKLVVNGAIRAKRILVETGWSDFVFEKKYKLKTLEEVEKFIKQNGHLPEIPSANEVECNGGDLGELVKLQMQKIEELTLYIIEQNKKIEELGKRIK